jgi:hypothetical protein
MACCGVATLSGTKLFQAWHHVKRLQSSLNTLAGHIDLQCWMHGCGTRVSPPVSDL